MPMTEAEIRAANPTWTDEQVAAEVARQATPPPAPPEPVKPEPPKPDDRAFAEMRRRAEAAEKEAARLKRADEERERKAAEEQGEWQKLAETERARREAAEAAQAAAEQRVTAAEQRRNAERAAGDLKFADAGYALYLLEQQRVDFADAAAVGTALDALKTARPDMLLVPPPPLPSGGPTGGPPGKPPGLTAAQISAMSPTDLAAFMKKEGGREAVNAALAAP